MSIFLEGIKHERESHGISVVVDDIRKAVQRHHTAADQLPKLPLQYTHDAYLSCSQGEPHKIKWELVCESCAAGFAYILEGEPGTFEEDLTRFPANERIRKILVVDVGAGSTDAGYMLRVIRPRNSKGS
jgi:hypothetical protein